MDNHGPLIDRSIDLTIQYIFYLTYIKIKIYTTLLLGHSSMRGIIQPIYLSTNTYYYAFACRLCPTWTCSSFVHLLARLSAGLKTQHSSAECYAPCLLAWNIGQSCSGLLCRWGMSVCACMHASYMHTCVCIDAHLL